MRLTTLFLVLLLSIALSACEAKTGATNTLQATLPAVTTRPGSAPLVNTPAYINPGHVTIGPGGVYHFTPEPVAGTPEPDPRLILRVALVDACTGRPVRGDVLVGDEGQGARQEGDLVYQGVNAFTLELPGQADSLIYVTVKAEGYEVWSQGYRYHLVHSRTLDLTVKLTPTFTPVPAPGQVG
jgi:hypothetical protein